ncbi:MAG: dihydrolipoamide acetyltransferase family protein [Eubacteriales bacterium]|nr:dihydrolipoamide acetyltransferase family protein [Eubacteriales bacterium]
MATEVYMPKNGMDMTEGTIIQWLKNEGDRVERDEPIMEIETDKITMESESPASGVLLKKLYEDGAVVPVLTVIGYIGEPGEEIPDAPAAETAVEKKEEAPAAAVKAEVPVKILASTTAIPATPYAKKIAADNGIDLAEVQPTGRYGEIRAIDVENAIHAQPKATPLARAMAADMGIDLKTVAGSGYRGKITSADLTPEEAAQVEAAVKEIEEILERRKLSGMRKVIAQRMSASHTEIPNVTQNIKVDVTELLALRAKINQGKEKADKVSVNDLIIKAVGKAVAEFERFRMTLEGDEYVIHNQINVGMAVGIAEGLLVPVIRDVDKKSLVEVSKKAKELAKKAREGKLMPDELGDGRITISNIGMYGTHSFTPIINQPEASIVGVCGTEDELALQDGEVVVRKKMMICVTFDHRILNGTEVCEFESCLKNLLENPISILI